MNMKSPYFFLFACILSEETTFTLTYYPFFHLFTSTFKYEVSARLGRRLAKVSDTFQGEGGLLNGLEGGAQVISFSINLVVAFKGDTSFC